MMQWHWPDRLSTPTFSRHRKIPRIVLTAGLLIALFFTPNCGNDESPTKPTEALFLIRVCRGADHAPSGETFRVLIRDPRVIAEAESLIGRPPSKVVLGPLLSGNGGFNRPWSWHIDPNKVGFSEGSIELCDGCPSFVETDLKYWLGNVGNYCPWSTEVVSRLR